MMRATVRRLRCGALWLWLMAKRLYHKPVFLVILLLVPALVGGYAAIPQGESGVMSVALAGGGDADSERVIAALQDTSEIVYFRRCATPAEARELVAAGKVDAAWIFPADLRAAVRAFVARPAANPFVSVVVREDSVLLRLSRESLGGALFPTVARRVYVDFVRQLAPELDELSEDTLLLAYDRAAGTDSLFSFNEAHSEMTAVSYLLSPLRGLLGVLIALCAMAAAMYEVRDRAGGTFCRVRRSRRAGVEFACQLVAVGHMALASAVCLWLVGLAAGWREGLMLVLYSLCCATFAMMWRRVFFSLRALAASLPAVIVLMLVLCPVFFDFGPLRLFSWLFPPTYYICAVYNPAYLWYMPVYAAACLGLYVLLGHLPARREAP